METVTHGSRGDIVDGYTTLPWASVYEEVAKLRIALVERKVIQLRDAAGHKVISRGLGRPAPSCGAHGAALSSENSRMNVSTNTGFRQRCRQRFSWMRREASRIPFAASAKASSISDQLLTAFPSRGSAFSFPNGADCHSQERIIIGITRAVPSSWRASALFISTS